MNPHACGLSGQCGRCAAPNGGLIRALGRPCGANMNPHARRCRVCVALLFTIGCLSATAQKPSHLSDAESAPPSRWTVDAARLDEQIRLRLLSADDPRSHWIAGQFDSTDIASKVKHYAAARTSAPQENLYLASLAMACLQPVQPTLPECDAVDRLADWATRDLDNGLPTMLLAARASKRGDNDATIAYLELAATKPRFDEYSSHGWLEYWQYVMAFPVDIDRAAKTELAAGYGAAQALPALALVPGPCQAPPGIAETRRAACAKAGGAMAERSLAAVPRAIGAGIAERNAADERTAQRVRANRVALQALLARCGDDDRAMITRLESPDAAIRAGTADAWDRIVREKARTGEIAECERRLSASR